MKWWDPIAWVAAIIIRIFAGKKDMAEFIYPDPCLDERVKAVTWHR